MKNIGKAQTDQIYLAVDIWAGDVGKLQFNLII